MNRKFKVIKVEVGDWWTGFTIKDLNHENTKNSMSPEGLIHHIGGLFGRKLSDIEGLEFEVIVPNEVASKTKLDPLALCGQIITSGVLNKSGFV